MDQTKTAINDWEELLKDVTYERGWREILWDSTVIADLGEEIGLNDMMNERVDEYPGEEQWNIINMLRRIADRKLEGMNRKIFLLYLFTGKNYEQIAAILGIHPDTVRRSIERAMDVMREFFQEKGEGDYPIGRGKRPLARIRVFPLDSHEEKKHFQHFLNEHVVCHLAYSGNDLFREAMVVYLTNQEKKRVKGDSREK